MYIQKLKLQKFLFQNYEWMKKKMMVLNFKLYTFLIMFNFPFIGFTLQICKDEITLGCQLGKRGGFGVVCRAVCRNRNVAVKEFDDYTDKTVAMFYEKLKIMMLVECNFFKSVNIVMKYFRHLCDHPNVLKVEGYCHIPHESKLWLVLELVPGSTLENVRTRTSTGN